MSTQWNITQQQKGTNYGYIQYHGKISKITSARNYVLKRSTHYKILSCKTLENANKPIV